jgi:WD40 repeat protein
MLHRSRSSFGIVALCLGTWTSLGPPVAAQERLSLEGHQADKGTGRVLAVAFAPGGKTLASGSFDRTVKLWDLATGKEQATLPHTGPVYALAWSPDGLTLATGSAAAPPSPGKTAAGQVRLWQVASGKETALLPGHDAVVFCLAYAPDGRSLATGSADGSIKRWDIASGREAGALQGHTGPIYGVAYAPDGKTLASASSDGTVRLWDLATGKVRATLQGKMEFWSATFSADGKYLAAGEKPRREQMKPGPDRVLGQARLWDTATWKEQAVFKRNTGDVRTALFTPDSKLLVFIDHKNVMFYDVNQAKPRRLADFLPKSGVVTTSLAISPDGQLFATGGQDGIIRVWEMAKVLDRSEKK